MESATIIGILMILILGCALGIAWAMWRDDQPLGWGFCVPFVVLLVLLLLVAAP